MPSKLRKALGAVKDQTSISLAKVTNAANLEVIILKATTHDPTPMENRYVNEIVQLVSSNKVYAAACAQAIAKRIGKTRNWVVALKSLMLVLRIFQDGDPYFPREVFHAMKRGAKILNLSSFRDDSNSSPWDYTAFVRTFALYLDERLDCFLTGKLQRRFNYHNQIYDKNYRLSNEPGIKDMKPTMLLDRISYWQRLLDRAISTRPTGSARTNRLVQISLYAIVRESFDLYKDISDGLVVILDNFFELPYQACVCAFQACVKSSKQFDELSAFYSLCTSIGIGRTLEYPSIQKVSDEVTETLQDFLRDQVSNTTQSSLSKHPFLPTPKDLGSSSGQDEAFERYETPKMSFENASEYGSQCTSLEDLMSATDTGFSPRASLEQDMYSDESDQDDKQSQNDDFSSAYDDSGSIHSLPAATWSSLDLFSLDDFRKEYQKGNQIKDKDQEDYSSLVSNNGSKDCWELVLTETATKSNHKASPKSATRFDPFSFDAFSDQYSVPQHHYNPFLEDVATVAPSIATVGNQFDIMDSFDTGSKFQAISPSFCAQSSNDAIAPTFYAQNFNDATIAPTFNIVQKSNFETDLAPIFGNLYLDDMAMASTFKAQGSTETNRVPSFKAQKECNRTPTFSSQDSTNTNLAWGFQTQNPNARPSFEAQKEFNMTPTFSAQDPTNTSMLRGLQSQNLDTTPNTKVQKEHNMATTFTIQDSTNTIMAQGFRSQNLDTVPSFKAQEDFNMTPAFNALDSTNTNMERNFQCQNPNMGPSFKSQNGFNTAPTFNAQDSTNNNMTKGFQSQNLDTVSSFQAQKEFTIATIFDAQDSTNNNMALGFQCQNSDTAPTFKAQKMFNMASTFNAQDSTNSNMTQGFQFQNSDMVPSFNAQKEFNMTLIFNHQNLTNTSMAQGFQSHNPDTLSSFKAQREFEITTTFNTQDSTNANMAQSFQSQNLDMTPFYVQSSFENGSASNFYGESLDERSTTPALSTQNFNVTMTSPLFATQNHTNPILEPGPSFQVQNFNQKMIVPTFSAKDFNEMTKAKADKDDPFEPSSSGITYKYPSIHSIQGQNLLQQQQQMWMEQQNKIIAKYMT